MNAALRFGLIAVLLLDLIFIFNGSAEYRFFSKTLLLPMILLYYFINAKDFCRWFVAGLVFSFFGDLFLLFPWGFLAGLGSFLTAHVFYIFSFRKLPGTITKFSTVLIFIYLVSFLTLLFPFLADMKFPVFLYGITISVMLYFGIRSRNGFIMLGAAAFIVSDSLLAYGMFVSESTAISLSVMMTYVFAQYLLTEGMIGVSNRNAKHLFNE